MQLGAVNHPAKEIEEELKWISKNGFSFVDFFIEPPVAIVENIKIEKIKVCLSKYKLSIIGHTGCILPIASCYPNIRKAALEELKQEMEIFSKLGARLVNLHLQSKSSLISNHQNFLIHLDSIKKAHAYAKDFDLELMVENSPFYDFRFTKGLLENCPQIGLHLDIAHAFIQKDLDAYLKSFYKRIFHMHISDNNGYEDLHLPIGAGKIDWEKVVRDIKKAGYDRTITLEIFSQDKDYLLLSRDKFLRLWRKEV